MLLLYTGTLHKALIAALFLIDVTNPYPHAEIGYVHVPHPSSLMCRAEFM